MAAKAPQDKKTAQTCDTCDTPHQRMTGSNDDPHEERGRHSRLMSSSSLAATSGQVDLVDASLENDIAAIPPPSHEVGASNSSRGRDGMQARAPRMGEGDGSTMPTGHSGNEFRSDHASTPLSATRVAATPAAGTGEGEFDCVLVSYRVLV